MLVPLGSTTATTVSSISFRLPALPSVTFTPSVTTAYAWTFEVGTSVFNLRDVARLQSFFPCWDAATRKAWIRRQRKEDRRRRRATRAAARKAEALLARFLTKGQRRDWATKQAFEVEGRDGDLYRIHRGQTHNVKRLDRATGAEVRSFCAHLGPGLPEADVALAQKMMLEACPDAFFAKANAR